MKNWIKFLWRKWIIGECRNSCVGCKFWESCSYDYQLTKSSRDYKQGFEDGYKQGYSDSKRKFHHFEQ